jgi:hypothetical protein
MKGEKKPSFLERTANFFEKLHYGIGAIALAGAALFGSEILAEVAILECIHGLAIHGLKNFIKRGFKKRSSPALAPA